MAQEQSILGGAPGMGLTSMPLANAPFRPPRPRRLGMNSPLVGTQYPAESATTPRNHEHDYFSAPGVRRYANVQPPQMHTNPYHPPNQGHFLAIAPAPIQPSGPTAQRMSNQEPQHRIYLNLKFKLSMDIDSSNGQISRRVVYGNGQGQGTSNSARNMEQRSRSRETLQTGGRRPVIRNDFNDRSTGWNMRGFSNPPYYVDTEADDTMDTSGNHSDSSSIYWRPPE